MTNLHEMAVYTAPVRRKTTKSRPNQGAHLRELRIAAGFTQVELSKVLGESQQNIAYWEQSDKPPRSDVLPKMAALLGVSVEDLLHPERPAARRGGPVGKMRLMFDEISKLPRQKQEKILEFLSPLVNQYKRDTRDRGGAAE